MTTTLETIISTICSGYSTISEMAGKTGFSISDPKEARLAFDIFSTYGFDANLYHDKHAARLYIKKPNAAMAAQLPHLLQYAQSLKDIKFTLAKTHPDFTMRFTNTDRGRQITIHLEAASPMVISKPSPHKSEENIPIQQTSVSRPSRQPVDEFQEDFFLGPQVVRPRGRRKTTETRIDSSYKAQLKNYVKGSSAGAFALALAGLFGLIFLYSVFQVSKGFICPDFVVAEQDKNRAWYCK